MVLIVLKSLSKESSLPCNLLQMFLDKDWTLYTVTNTNTNTSFIERSIQDSKVLNKKH